jgi:hypothetical protein
MRAGDAGMLKGQDDDPAPQARPADRELWACWNLLTRFWVPLVHIGMESNHLL